MCALGLADSLAEGRSVCPLAVALSSATAKAAVGGCVKMHEMIGTVLYAAACLYLAAHGVLWRAHCQRISTGL